MKSTRTLTRPVSTGASADPARIPAGKPRRLDPVSGAWADKYRAVAHLNPHLTGEDLARAVEKHFGGAA